MAVAVAPQISRQSPKVGAAREIHDAASNCGQVGLAASHATLTDHANTTSMDAYWGERSTKAALRDAVVFG